MEGFEADDEGCVGGEVDALFGGLDELEEGDVGPISGKVGVVCESVDHRTWAAFIGGGRGLEGMVLLVVGVLVGGSYEGLDRAVGCGEYGGEGCDDFEGERHFGFG